MGNFTAIYILATNHKKDLIRLAHQRCGYREKLFHKTTCLQSLGKFRHNNRCMFDGPGFPKSLDEEIFNLWLEKGRLSKIGYHYLLVVWDEYDSEYQPVYAADRDEIKKQQSAGSRERLIAAYDLYSESRIV
jgi:hypothetical protein